jgi:hypothetical protein
MPIDWLKSKVKSKRSKSKASVTSSPALLPSTHKTTGEVQPTASIPPLESKLSRKVPSLPPSASPDVAIRSSTSITGEEVVGWVKQLLNITKEALDGIPGKGAVSTLSAIAEMIEVS